MANIRTPEVKAIVSIHGEKVDFIRLKIDQEMAHHHEFEVLVDHKTFTETFYDSPDKMLKKTNTKVVIDLLHADQPGNAYVFSGMVETIRMISEDGAHGSILFKGKSNTIELERGEMMQTYSDTNLQTLFREITSGTLNLTSVITPTWKSDIDFTLQYKESDWDFLLRTCCQYHEPVYYTGTDLVIGKHKEFPTTDLTYDLELRRFEISSRLIPNHYSTYYYDRDEHQELKQDSPGSIDGAPDLLNIVSQRSDNLTLSRKPKTPTDAFIPDMSSLIDHTKRRKITTGGRMMYVRGECKTCDVRIGRIINVSMPNNLGGAYLGSYRVYSVKHEFDQSGRYTSHFEAIPSHLEYIPLPRIPVPTPNLLQAEVWDNEDPKGMGRIRVHFPFDDKQCGTWIPVMTPDAGGKDLGLGPASRGYSFIPEKQDTVAISFLDSSQLCHPVVVGSMYHGKNAENLGGGQGNHLKTIRDKSGSAIMFNDKEGSLVLKDKNGSDSTMTFDGQQNIHVNAQNSILLTSGKSSIYMDKDGTINITGVNITINGSTQTIMLSGGAQFEATSQGAVINMTGTTSTVHGGNTTTISGQVKTTVTAVGQTIIDGAIVKLN